MLLQAHGPGVRPAQPGHPVRVLAVYLAPGWYVGWILLSGLLWLLAFWAFAVVYNPKAATRFPRGLKRIMPPYWAAR